MNLSLKIGKSNLKIVVVGMGYVGLSMTVLLGTDHDVVAVDTVSDVSNIGTDLQI